MIHYRCLTKAELCSHPDICQTCRERQPPLHPGAILTPMRGWQLVRQYDEAWEFMFKPFPRCPGCGRVIGRCPDCGDAPVDCRCAAPFLVEVR